MFQWDDQAFSLCATKGAVNVLDRTVGAVI